MGTVPCSQYVDKAGLSLTCVFCVLHLYVLQDTAITEISISNTVTFVFAVPAIIFSISCCGILPEAFHSS